MLQRHCFYGFLRNHKQINRRGWIKSRLPKIAGLFPNQCLTKTDLHKTHRNQKKPANLKISQESVSKSIGGVTQKTFVHPRLPASFQIGWLLVKAVPHKNGFAENTQDSKEASFFYK